MKFQGTYFQSVFKFLLAECDGLIVIVRADDLKIKMLFVHGFFFAPLRHVAVSQTSCTWVPIGPCPCSRVCVDEAQRPECS